MQEFEVDAAAWSPGTVSPRASSPTIYRKISDRTCRDCFLVFGYGEIHMPTTRYILDICLPLKKKSTQLAYIDTSNVHIPKHMRSSATPSLAMVEIDAFHNNVRSKHLASRWHFENWKQILANYTSTNILILFNDSTLKRYR